MQLYFSSNTVSTISGGPLPYGHRDCRARSAPHGHTAPQKVACQQVLALRWFVQGWTETVQEWTHSTYVKY